VKPAASATSARSFPARRGPLLAGGLLALAAAAAYGNSFSGPFILDDVRAIAQNLSIRHFWRVWSPPAGLTVSGRPLLNFSVAVNYALGGLKVWGYHALNLVIHTLAGLALFGLVRRTLLRPGLRRRFGPAALPLAFSAAALWTLHPLQTEAVTYIIQRAESMMGMFYLLTMYCFVRGVECTEAGQQTSVIKSGPISDLRFLVSYLWLPASVLCCLLGMASKEVIASAPLMVLLYDRTFASGSFRAAIRIRWKFYLAMAASWLFLGGLVLSTGGDRNGTVGFNVGVGWWAYASTQFEAITRYLLLSFWPHPLVFEYGTFWVKNFGEIVPYAIVVVPLVAGTAVALWRWPAAGFLGAWFFVMLAPTSLLPGTTQMIVEHRMYLSLAAVIVPVVLAFYQLAGKRSFILLLALAAGLGWTTSRRNDDYRSWLTIWSDTVRKRPDNALAHNNLGFALSAIYGRLPAAIAEYQKALHFRPDYPEAHNNLGIALTETGHVQAALSEYKEALRLRPNYAEAHSNLGSALAGMGRLPEAIAELETALRLSPYDADVHNNLGSAMAEMGRLPEAIYEYETALTLRPDYPQTHHSLGVILAHMPGRLPDAIAHFQAAIALKPDFPEDYNDLGLALMTLPGRLPDAIAQFESALRFNPNYAEAHNNLGIALAKSGRLSEAVAHFETALRLKPDYPEAENNLGIAYMGMPGRVPDAIAHFAAAVRLKPNYADAQNGLGIALMNIPGRQSEALAHFEAALRLKPDIEPARQMVKRWQAAQK